jgi:vancomycin resistance protein VanW
MLRDYIPLQVRQEIRHVQRCLKDRKDNIDFKNTKSENISETPIRLTQPIMQSNFYENKVRNIQRACALLSAGSIDAHHYWSFWHRIGRPTSKNGFHKGRNLVNGELSVQTGGGLCQISSIIYHLSLIAGLKIIERHSHSVDIYKEHLRFTPLGADSTVVWGSKDLRLFNPYDFSVSFMFAVKNGSLVGEIYGEQPIHSRTVEFRRMSMEDAKNKVETLIDGIVVTTNMYAHKPV